MSGNITNSEKQNIGAKDYVTLGLLLAAALPATVLTYRILNFSQETKKEKKNKQQMESSHQQSKSDKQNNQAGNATSQSRSGKTLSLSPTSSSANQRKTGHKYQWLMKVNPLTLVSVTASFQYARLILDVASWLWVVISKRWDLTVKLIDGFSTLIGTLGSCLLVIVFLQRCFVTFNMTHVQHPSWIYSLVFGSALLSASSAIFMSVCVFGQQWRLLGTASVCFIITLTISSSLATWFFVSPLRALAKETKSMGLLHVAARLSIVAAVSLISTVISYLFAAIAYNSCDECPITYVYYSMTTADTIINLLCMIWSLKAGQKEYYQVCRVCHSECVRLLTPGEDDTNTLPIDKQGTVGE